MKHQHGGPRPGSGRKRVPESQRSVTMQIRFPRKVMDDVQRAADSLDVSRNEIIKLAVAYAMYDKSGVYYTEVTGDPAPSPRDSDIL